MAKVGVSIEQNFGVFAINCCKNCNKISIDKEIEIDRSIPKLSKVDNKIVVVTR